MNSLKSILILFVLVFFISCKDDRKTVFKANKTRISNDSSESYAGPGSKWEVILNKNGTFDIEEQDRNLFLEGTWTKTDAGFKKLTVTSSSDIDEVPLGSVGHALEIPGMVLLLKPFNGTQIISMIKSGVCPTDDFSANWIVTSENSNVGSSDVFGTFFYDYINDTANLPNRYTLEGVDQGANSLPGFVCNNGIAEVGDGRMFLTEMGAAIVHTGILTPVDKTDDNIIIALPPKNIGSLSALDGVYKGLVFASSANGNELFTVSINISDGTGSGNEIDPDSGDLGDYVSINFSAVDTPNDGLIEGTIDGSVIKCMANTNIYNSEKTFLFCIGDNPDEAGKLYLMFMIN